jgi:phenylalanyl-tRNA synthetase alpha chain
MAVLFAVRAPCRRLALHRSFAAPRRHLSTPPAPAPAHLRVLGDTYVTDDYTNVPPSILAKLPARLHERPGHPLHTLRALVEAHFASYAHLSVASPLVTPAQNFDSLSFPADHPGRARSDSYYLSRSLMLRTHTSAHVVETFARGHDRWLLTADVYRRDEIDAAHYPVFHQMEGARLFGTDARALRALADENAAVEARLARENIVIADVPHHSPTNPVQPAHAAAPATLVAHSLKLALNGLLLSIFGHAAGGATKDEPLRVRWIEAEFPFTSPSFEVEVFFRGKWLEILGSGVVLQSTLDRASASMRSLSDITLKTDWNDSRTVVPRHHRSRPQTSREKLAGPLDSGSSASR